MGALFGQIQLALLIAAGVNLVWHYSFQYRLLNWLWSRSTLMPPQGYGSWEYVFNGIYLLQQRHRARRKELVHLIRRFREGAEALPDAAVVFRENGKILWCNRLSSQLLGFRWPEDSGQHVGNLIRFPEFHRYLEHQEFHDPLELNPDASQDKILEFRIMPYTNGQFMLVVRDVTQLRKLEKLRKHFVANVSHELRTPLTVLKGYLELYNPMENQFDAKQVYPVLRDQTNRMDSLVNQLLTLSKIEATPLETPSTMIDVPKLLDSCAREAKTLSGDKQHQIQTNIERNLCIYGDESQFRSAVCNLINNAVHYTPAHKAIHIFWERYGHDARFCVQDEGEGIAEKHIARLTERFYRVDRARSRSTGGAGLGLAIVKHALSRHESELQITSDLGIGSSFSFVIPSHLIVNAQDDLVEPTETARISLDAGKSS